MIAFRELRFAELGSTNDEARAQLAAGAKAGTIVVAERQTAGRGRMGRDWVSPSGNLYTSLILKPGCPMARAAELSFVTALAVAETVAGALPDTARVTCKWPNDVLVDGAKISGILLESHSDDGRHLSWVIIGVGINVASAPAGLAYAATSIASSGGDANVDAVLAAYQKRIGHWYEVWQRDGFVPVREAWLARADRLGETIRVRLANSTLDGTFISVDTDGALMLRTDAGDTVKVAAGDVLAP